LISGQAAPSLDASFNCPWKWNIGRLLIHQSAITNSSRREYEPSGALANISIELEAIINRVDLNEAERQINGRHETSGRGSGRCGPNQNPIRDKMKPAINPASNMIEYRSC